MALLWSAYRETLVINTCAMCQMHLSSRSYQDALKLHHLPSSSGIASDQKIITTVTEAKHGIGSKPRARVSISGKSHSWKVNFLKTVTHLLRWWFAWLLTSYRKHCSPSQNRGSPCCSTVSLRRQFTSLLWLSTRCASGSPTTACWHLAAHEGLMFPSGPRLGLFHFVLTEKCICQSSCRQEDIPAAGAKLWWHWNAQLSWEGCEVCGAELSGQPLKARASHCQSPASRRTLQFRALQGLPEGKKGCWEWAGESLTRQKVPSDGVSLTQAAVTLMTQGRVGPEAL